MNYDENHLVKDFALRTQENLRLVKKLENNPDYRFFEVTQLINSMLGLLVFPKVAFINKFPNKLLSELEKEGWPRIVLLEGDAPCNDLQALINYLRNAIAHFNLKFLSKDGQNISGLELWNIPYHSDRVNWRVRLSLDDLRTITDKFIDLIKKVDENG